MRFTRIALAVSFNLVIGSIVVPVGQRVNHHNTTNSNKAVQTADGMPLPPLPPNAVSTTLLADGMPLPPLPPPKNNEVTLLADGMPLPPLPPPNANGMTVPA
jgi:hypothetical protein